MGWLSGWESKSTLVAHLCDEAETSGTLLARRVVGSELWMVWQRPDGTCEIVLALLSGRSGSWGYKDMSEAMGPYYFGCPIAFFDLAPPPPCKPGSFVAGWRDMVRRRAAEAKARRARRAAICVGDVLVLVKGCRPRELRVTSVKPLRGLYEGNEQLYHVAPRLIAEVRPAGALPGALDGKEAADLKATVTS